MADLDPYFLIDNAFPDNPVMDPSGSDPRTNGAIFNSAIRGKELENLREKLAKNLSLIYLRALMKAKGYGKSAVAVHEWKRLKQQRDITSVYVRVSETWWPVDFTINVVQRWHEGGYLWDILIDSLRKYAEGNPSPAIPLDVIDDIIASNPKMPAHVDLGRYIYRGTVSSVIRKIAEWASTSNKAIVPEVAEAFYGSYLSKPSDFMKTYYGLRRKLRGRDEIDFVRSILELSKLSRYKHHFVFLDQFEDALKSKGKSKDLERFCSGMRRMIEAGLGAVTYCVTLHLDANQLLGIPQSAALTEVAPRGQNYTVDIEKLNKEQTRDLVVSYLTYYRGNHKPPNEIYPLDETAIGYVNEITQGNPRWILRSFHFAVEKGRAMGFPQISKDFIMENHEEVLSKAVTEENKFVFRIS